LVDSTGAGSCDGYPSALTDLFHRLNNQLGVILAHAELVESKVVDEATRARAALIVTSALGAMETVRTIRARTEGPRQ
jgi:hypothetical protein